MEAIVWGLVVVATSTLADGRFSNQVSDAVDEGEECDEEEEETAPRSVSVPDMPCLDTCGPREFYRSTEQLFEWFAGAIGG